MHSAYGIPIRWFLTVGAMLFCIGLFGMMIRRSAIGMLLSIELMLNAANINLVAFGSYLKHAGDRRAGVRDIRHHARRRRGGRRPCDSDQHLPELEQHIDADKISAMKM